MLSRKNKPHIPSLIKRIVIWWGLMLFPTYFFAQINNTDWSGHRQRFDSLAHANIGAAKLMLDSLIQVAETQTNPQSKTRYYAAYNGAYYAFITHQMDASREGFVKALQIAESNDWQQEAIDSKIWVGNHHYFSGDHELASEIFAKVVEEAEAIQYIDGLANGFYGQSIILVDQGQILQQMLKIDSLYQAHDTVSAILSNSYGAIGDIYFRSYNNPEAARRYYDLALTTAQKVNYLPGIVNMQKLLADLAIGREDYDLAAQYYRDLSDYYTQVADTVSLAYLILDQAGVDLQTQKYQQCEAKLVNALDYFYNFADTTAIGNTHLMLATLFTLVQDAPKVKEHIALARQFPNRLVPEQYEIKLLEADVGYYQLLGNFESAYYTRLKLDSLKSQQLAQQNGKAFLELEQKYRAKEREQDIELLTTQNRLIEQRSQNQKVLFIGGGVLLFLALLSLWMLYRNKQKTNNRLRDLDRMKSNFLANISHEFRTPLTLISVPIEDRLQADHISPQDKKMFDMIKRNQTRLINLVDQLLDLSKIDAGSLHLNLAADNLMRFLKVIAEPFTYIAQKSDLTFTIQIDDSEDQYWFDADAMEKIVTNLLSNAFKYTLPGKAVQLSAKTTEGWLSLEVANEGDALTDQQKLKIFDKFYQVDQDQPGTGIGLALVKELVTMHDGSIKVSNQPSGWVTFSLSLAVQKEFYRDKVKVSIHETTSDQSQPKTLEDAPMVELVDSELPVMLIVEDHPEVLELLQDTFKENYQIFSASDGMEGKKLALQHIPDIIISDVMMPIMDGVALTTELKQDERTSHIPVILLTAKAGEEHHLQGLQIGADDYITKPFSSKLLRAKVSSLVELRQQLRAKYRQELILQPEDIALSSVEEQFLDKLKNILDQHLTNPEFNVSVFSDSLAMSRMQLHRKLKALTGQSASEFIRSQRLKMAAELLKKTNANISEIGYAVGFNDPSYFTRCFKEEFQVTPTEYASQHALG